MAVVRLLLALASLVPALGEVATPLTADERNVVHFAFGTQLGSGVYVISGRTVQIYRLPFGYQLRPADENTMGVRLTLPVTIGFVGFEPRDVIDTGLPENLDTLSFVPGLELDIPMNGRWRLLPFVEAGVARDRTSEFEEYVYAVGLRSRVPFEASAADWTLFNELVHVGVELQQPDDTDDFTRFRTGLTVRRALGRRWGNHQPDVLWYALHEWYLDAPGGPVKGEDDEGSATQLEFGLTFGATEQLYVGRVPLPRVGIGYRFGGDLSVVRVVFGSPF